MDYRRTYWLVFLGIGALFAAQAAVPVVAGEPVGLTVAASAVAAVIILLAAALALRDPSVAGGPEGPTPLFWLVVLAFLLLVAGTAAQLLAL